MNKPLKVFLVCLAIILFIVIFLFSLFLIATFKYDVNDDKLVDTKRGIVFYDADGNIINEVSEKGFSIVKIEELPDDLISAFVAIEDKRFFSHNGIDKRALIRAAFNNLLSLSFKEGGSTISQQLIKNTHLTAEKTFKRKLIEIKLAKKLEKKYTKKQILEKYLNTIYFGSGNYGIASASKTYFDKSPSELTLNECALLAGCVKAPSVYSPFTNEEKCFKRKNVVLGEMYKQGYINKDIYEKAVKEYPCVIKQENKIYDYFYLTKKEISDFLDKNPYTTKKVNVYTAIDKKIQDKTEKIIETAENYNKSLIVINDMNQIIAYASTSYETKRSLGSVIKPLLVYAPAIEENKVYLCTKIRDEKINIGGYSPSNYNDKYYGNVTIKDSLSKSLNSCAVKLLNHTGIDNSLKYFKKLGIEITKQDNSLALALGSTVKGATIKEIASAYQVFLHEGEYTSASCIVKITDDKGIKLYESTKNNNRVFSKGTANLISDALKTCAKEGTAKKLSFINVPLCSKTGTVGDKNGNTDAYSISYNNEYIVGSTCYLKDEVMPNSITGGTRPTEMAADVWKEIYKTRNAPMLKFTDEIKQDKIDSLSYENDDVVILADDNAPKRYIKEELFSEKNFPKNKSDRFTHPKIEKPILSANKNEIKISLCQTEYYEIRIIKEKNNVKEKIYDSLNNEKKNVISDVINRNDEYSYYAIPYYKNDNKIFYGKEIFIGKVKYTPIPTNNDKWWKDEFI